MRKWYEIENLYTSGQFASRHLVVDVGASQDLSSHYAASDTRSGWNTGDRLPQFT